MKNRIEEFVSLPKSAGADADSTDQSRIDLGESLKSVTEWAVQHPVACLATAFIFGGAVAWIVKRR
jgi:hypothetical protein